jgi:hypothetical protein
MEAVRVGIGWRISSNTSVVDSALNGVSGGISRVSSLVHGRTSSHASRGGSILLKSIGSIAVLLD